MITRLKEYNRLNETVFMGLLTLFCFAVSIFRFVYTDTKVFLFLNWNLFLAFVPWAISSLMMISPKLRQSKWMFALLLCTWLLFFPNAPYILTDLFHLRLTSSMPVWFDLILILSFAWTGLLVWTHHSRGQCGWHVPVPQAPTNPIPANREWLATFPNFRNRREFAFRHDA